MANLEVQPKTFPDGSENYGAGIIGPSKADVEWANRLTHELAKEGIVVASKGSSLGRIVEATLGRTPKRVAIPVAGLTTLLAVACSSGELTSTIVSETQTPTTTIATSESTPTPEILPECKIIPSLAPGVIKPEMLNLGKE